MTKHKNQCITNTIVQSNKVKELVTKTLIENVESKITMMDKLIQGCADYLVDPEDPNKYFLGARGSEVNVVYVERREGKEGEKGKVNHMQKKATLQALLDVVESTDRFIVQNAQVKHSDPRDLLLKGINELKAVSKMLIDAAQTIKDNEQKNKAYAKVAEMGGVISIEKQVQMISEKIIFAFKQTESQELTELAGLPDLD